MSKALDAWDDIKARLQSIAQLGEAKVVKCKDSKDLILRMQGVPSPMCGVVYEGMRRQASGVGIAAVSVYGVYLAVDSVPAVRSLDTSSSTLDLLDLMRDVLLDQRAPGGHRWSFVAESFSGITETKAVWVQRWDVLVILQAPR